MTRGHTKNHSERGMFKIAVAVSCLTLMCLWGTSAVAQVKITHKVSATQGNLTRLLEMAHRFGNAVANIGDIDDDGVGDIAVGAAYHDYPGVIEGTVWILFMKPDGTVKNRQKIGSEAGGFTGVLDSFDHFGISVAGIGDLDGDGVEDIVVGAELDDDGGAVYTADRGAVWILFLKPDGTVKSQQKISQLEGGFGGTLDDGDFFGRSVCAAGDLDIDGHMDIYVGAHWDDDGGPQRGAVWIVYLNANGTVKAQAKISATEGGFDGLLDNGDFFGSSIAPLGDLDGNGTGDVAVGATGDDDGGDDAGAVYVLFMNSDGTVGGTQKISATTGFSAGGGLAELVSVDHFGESISSIGFSPGDDVIMVGAPNDSYDGPFRGAVYWLRLAESGEFYDWGKFSDSQGGFNGVLDDNNYFGCAVAWVEDMDGNGYNEIVVGAWGDDDGGEPQTGAAWVVFLQDAGEGVPGILGEQKISQVEGDFTRLLLDAVNFGESAALIGDLNADGVNEVAVGAPRDAGGGSDRGAVWILSMIDAGTVIARQKIGDNAGGFTADLSNLDQFGRSIAAVGDLDGDGVEDIAVGAPMDSTGGPGRGAVYVLYLRLDGTVKSHLKIASNTGGFEHTLSDGDNFGYAVAGLGDVKNDGTYELAVSAINDDDGGTSRGAVWIVSLAESGLQVDSEQKISDIEGGFDGVLDDNDFFGTSLAALGDLDGDDVPDLVVGAIGDDDYGLDAGAVWLVYLQADRTVQTHKKISGDTPHLAGLIEAGDAFGYSAAALGDMDGDGYPELAIGAIGDDDGATDAGAVWIVLLDGTGVVKTHGKISNTQGNFGGVLDNADYFGTAVTPLGDLNSDDVPDILVGHSGDDDGGDEVGSVWPLNLSGPDDDGDGVYYASDSCPDDDASFFDRNGDGCIDDPIGARHTEYWDRSDTLVYYIHLDGAPNITDGSDFTALQNAVDKWTAIPATDMTATYGGTVDWEAAVFGDGNNFVTFRDYDYDFGTYTLAVGVATSFDVPVFHNGRLYRPGQVVDADMIFNPTKTFTTSGVGTNVDLESVATHEAGHLFGISHSAVLHSTMFYALQSGTEARSLETEDVTVYQKAYRAIGTDPNGLYGRVEDWMGEPVPGAVVFVTDTLTADTVACDFTLPDGSFKFIEIPVGTYYLSIYPLNGTSPIGYLEPEYVNALVDSTAMTLFPAEYWNTGDGTSEDPLVRTPIDMGAALLGPYAVVTNVDLTGPEVVSHTPDHMATDVGVDVAVVIEFSEAIEANSLQGNFRLFDTELLTGVGGTALVAEDGTLVSFAPSGLLEYSTAYACTLRAGITDLYSNPMDALYAFEFSTEDEPPLSLASIVPNKGAPGSIVVLNGKGFDGLPAGNTVSFTDSSGVGVVSATVLSATPLQLVVEVPAAAGSGLVNVTVAPLVSNDVAFTLLSSTGVPRGYEVGVAELVVVPRAVVVLPDGERVYVATETGATAVVVDPGLQSFLETTAIAVTGGLNDLDVTPDGAWVWGVSRVDSSLCEIDVSSNTVVDELPVFAEPRGIVIDPSGTRAYVATDEAEIQIWNTQQGSLNYKRQVGAMGLPGANLRGKMAIDPAGDYLLATTGTGKLLVFDLASHTFYGEVGVGSDTRDVVVDPAGQRAYVTDGSGIVSIVSLSGFFHVLDVPTSGSLRGAAMTPSGEYLYTANRQLNFLDVVDLVENSPSYRNVATTIPIGINPVDVEVSPDGLYAYSLVEDSKQLVVTGIGSGPVIKSLSRHAGPPGTKVVAAGDGFGTDPFSLVVRFEDASGATSFSAPERATGRAVTFSVPLDAESGPATLSIKRVGPPDETSNVTSFEVLAPLETEHLQIASQAELVPGVALAAAAVMSPLGDQFLVGTEDGQVIFVDTKPNSPTFNQPIKSPSVSTSPVHDIAVTPDGKRAYVCVPDDQTVDIIDADRASPTYATVIRSVSFGGFSVDTPRELAISPDGEVLLIQDSVTGLLYYVDILPGSPTENEVIQTMPVASASEITFNPSGTHAYLSLDASQLITTVCVDSSAGPFFWTKTSELDVTTVVPGHPLTPLSISVSPKGDRCVVLADDDASGVVYLALFEISYPETTMFMTATMFGEEPLPPPPLEGQRLDISPGGDRLVYHQNGVGVVSVSLSDVSFGARRVTATPFTLQSEMDHDFTVDGRNLYAVGTYGDSLQVYSYGLALPTDTLLAVSGNGQTGVAGLALAAALRVRIHDYAGPKAGMPVTFQVASGGGVFTATNGATQIVPTNANGIAEVSWQLGTPLGAQSVTATAAAVGSPVTFTATAVIDPNTLPLELVDILPVDGATGVATTTTITATFSRPVAPASVTTSSVFFHKTGETTAVPGQFGFANNNRVVSITPLVPLDFSTPYTLEITAAVQDQSSGPLTNPATRMFTTTAAPALQLVSASPPSGTVGITVVLGGVGFNPTASSNEVFFGSKKAIPFEGAFDYLKVKVPPDAETGSIHVYNGVDTSNEVPFNVLVPTNVATDAVIATINTGTSTKGVVIDPDGSVAYAVSPDGDVVIPIDMGTQASLPSISVGDYPISIDVHPEGTYIYVPNFNSNTVSIIGIDPDSPGEYHTVVKTLNVGTYPMDVVVNPDGNWVYVVNASSDYSNNVDIIDANSNSANHHSVVATLGTGQASKCLTITPDGSRLYIGTDNGYVVLNAGDLSYSVIATINTGTGTKGVVIDPDGAMLFVLTTEGNVVVYAIAPGTSGDNDVIATINTGTSTKGVVIDPDGSILYLIQEENDLINVFGIEIQGAIGVIDPEGTVPPFQVVFTPLGSFFAGEDPEAMVFDPRGSGLALVTNAGPRTVTFLNKSFVAVELPAGPILVPAYSTVPSITLDGFEMTNTTSTSLLYAYTISTVGPATLSGGTLSHSPASWEGGTGSSQVRGVSSPSITGVDEVLAASPPPALSSASTQVSGVTPALAPGGSYAPPAAVLNIPAIRQRVEQPIVYSVSVAGSTNLFVEGVVLVIIEPPVAVFVNGFFAEALEEGVRLSWDVLSDEDVAGFKIYRLEVGGEAPEIANGAGLVSGAKKEWVDEGARPGREYEYTLHVVLSSGGEVVSYPVSVKTRTLVFALDQNHPNPFNPTTSIGFVIPEREHVTLSIFNVAGQRVVTLVDEVMTEGYKKIAWDGQSSKGDPVGTGVYFYRLQAGKKTLTKKMTLLK